MSTTKPEGSARERLLAAANELFYEEGVHTVGIDRVIERAGVAKASLYSTFGSKEELVRAYLLQRAEARQHRLSNRIAQSEDPRTRILSIFDLMGELTADPKYRGCAFVNASAEGRRDEKSKVSQVCLDSRAWVRGLFIELARDAGADDPEELGRQLVVLYDGAAVAASMERDLDAAGRAKAMASALITAQTTADPEKERSSKKTVRATK
ncbi:MAG: TetR/AcrR family transcriptional regulator [Kofleriaceae bacterium]